MAKKKNTITNALRYFKALVKEVTDDGRLLGVIGSTAAVDRYDEIIDQNTWLLDHYKNNPVILWAHNLTFGEDRPPIGRADRVEVNGDGVLEFDIQFDMEDDFAADIFRKYKKKFLNAFSVGFIPHAFGHDDDGHTILMQNELLELSAVPVPANPEALQALRARSFSVRSWKSMIKEAEESQAEHAEEAADEVTNDPATEGDQPNSEPNTPSDGDGIVATDSPPEGSGDGEGGKGDSAAPEAPENPQLAASRVLVAVMREATRQMQSALALHNAAVRDKAGKTQEKGAKKL